MDSSAGLNPRIEKMAQVLQPQKDAGLALQYIDGGPKFIAGLLLQALTNDDLWDELVERGEVKDVGYLCGNRLYRRTDKEKE